MQTLGDDGTNCVGTGSAHKARFTFGILSVSFGNFLRFNTCVMHVTTSPALFLTETSVLSEEPTKWNCVLVQLISYFPSLNNNKKIAHAHIEDMCTDLPVVDQFWQEFPLKYGEARHT